MEGRWTLRRIREIAGERRFGRWEVDGLPASYESRDTEVETVPVVPCDDAAIERAIKAYARTDVHALTDRQVVTLIFRAAGETP
jgi:hypothetical protein